MITYAMDIAADFTVGELAQIMELCNATMAIVQAEGPGGGNPEVQFTFNDHGDYKRFVNEVEG